MDEVLSLESTWAKVERAKEHRDALEVYVCETFAVESNRPRLGAKFDPDSGENVLFVNYVPDLTVVFERVSLLLGDAVHCLRSALDHLVYQLSWREQGVRFNPRGTMFFIDDDADTIDGRGARWLSQVSADDRKVLRAYQGDQRIDDDLALYPDLNPMIVLRDLDDADKHRRLNTMMFPISSFSPDSEVARFIAMTGSIHLTKGFSTERAMFEDIPVELDAVVARLKTSTDASGSMVMWLDNTMRPLETEEEFAGYVLPEIALAEGWPVVGALDKIAALVVNVIREFEPFP
jgi:hypothetical protein